MTKKWLLLLSCLPAFVFAHEWSAEARAGYFYPVNKVVREIYHNGGAEGEVEGNYWFDPDNKWYCKNISVWGNVGYFDREGHSLGFDDETHLRLVPVSAGLKYFYPLMSYFDVYAGVGGSYTFVKVKDESPCEISENNTGDGGVVGKFGLFFSLPYHICVDVFADYYYTRVRFMPHAEARRHDVGGLRTGVGIGVVY